MKRFYAMLKMTELITILLLDCAYDNVALKLNEKLIVNNRCIEMYDNGELPTKPRSAIRISLVTTFQTKYATECYEQKREERRRHT